MHENRETSGMPAVKVSRELRLFADKARLESGTGERRSRQIADLLRWCLEGVRFF